MCDCETSDPVTDYASGTEVCRGCGVVLDSVVFSEQREWFEDRNCRAGAPTEPFLSAPSHFLATGAVSRRVLAAASADPERLLRDGFGAIVKQAGYMFQAADSLVVLRAKELFRDVHAVKTVRSDTRDAYAAAALYYGYKMEKCPRELKTLQDKTGVGSRQLNAAVDAFKVLLEGKPYHRELFATVYAGDLINAYGDRVPVSDADKRLLKKTAHDLDAALAGRLDTGRRPATVVSGMLAVAARRVGLVIPKKVLLAACGVCQQTLDRMAAEIDELLATN
jgi:hypothetical protein